MGHLIYLVLLIACFLVDVIPFVGPPAWTVMVFFYIGYDLNPWLVLITGVTGSALGRLCYSIYIKWLSNRYIRQEKNEDLQFLGDKLSGKGWRVHLFVLFYTLIPVPTTPLFTAAGIAGLRPLHIMPAFFIGKFASDAFMMMTGKYVVTNISSIASGLLSVQSIIGTLIGMLIISFFFFIDWRRLLEDKKLKLSFSIFKSRKHKL